MERAFMILGVITMSVYLAGALGRFLIGFRRGWKRAHKNNDD